MRHQKVLWAGFGLASRLPKCYLLFKFHNKVDRILQLFVSYQLKQSTKRIAIY